MHSFPSSMSIQCPHGFWVNSSPDSQSPFLIWDWRPVVPLEMSQGASDWPVFLSYFAETLVSFELELAVYIYVPNLPSLVWTLYSAPSKPLLEAEPLTSSPCSQEPQKLLGITQTGLPQKVAPRSPSPDKQSPKLLRSLLLEFFNGVINLLLIFGIILIKTVLCMYY